MKPSDGPQLLIAKEEATNSCRKKWPARNQLHPRTVFSAVKLDMSTGSNLNYEVQPLHSQMTTSASIGHVPAPTQQCLLLKPIPSQASQSAVSYVSTNSHLHNRATTRRNDTSVGLVHTHRVLYQPPLNASLHLNDKGSQTRTPVTPPLIQSI